MTDGIALNVHNNFCPRCRAYLWTSGGKNHRCPPLWQCRLDEDDKRAEDFTDTYAHSAEAAAQTFAEEMDPGNDYFILQAGDRSEIVVEVLDRAGKTTRFRITAESVPSYYAEEVSAADDE